VNKIVQKLIAKQTAKQYKSRKHNRSIKIISQSRRSSSSMGLAGCATAMEEAHPGGVSAEGAEEGIAVSTSTTKKCAKLAEEPVEY
jgi:hypothetical protein